MRSPLNNRDNEVLAPDAHFLTATPDHVFIPVGGQTSLANIAAPFEAVCRKNAGGND